MKEKPIRLRCTCIKIMRFSFYLRFIFDISDTKTMKYCFKPLDVGNTFNNNI